MGREAYLARLAFGRSAFGSPFHNDAGEYLVGDHVASRNDSIYQQQWDEWGHPVNTASVETRKDYHRVQNEVLEACGIIVHKDAVRRRNTETTHEVSEQQQLEKLNQENNDGFALKYGDRLGGYLLTWWLELIRMRMLSGDGSTSETFTSTVVEQFNATPVAFLFGGFVPWLIANTAKILREPDRIEPLQCMNYLQLPIRTSQLSWRQQLEEWSQDLSCAAIEVPFMFLSLLQAMNFPVLSIVWTSTKHALRTSTWPSSLHHLYRILVQPQLSYAIGMYFIRDYLAYQLGWRLFGLLRQTLPRPNRPTKLSIRVAEEDDMLDDISVVGIGRGLGSHTIKRFYGPRTFLSALSVAFPWFGHLSGARHTMEDTKWIKETVLARSADLERTWQPHPNPGEQFRAEYITSNLESLNVDVEEDFYVDVDQWTREIPTYAERARRMSEYAAIADDSPAHTDDRSLTPNHVLEDNDDIVILPTTPPTPEPGIVRAVSLTEIPPRPVRRPTEITEPEFDEELQASLAARFRQPRRKDRDGVLYRITRITVFPVDSFAWHASSLLTSIAMLPLDIIFSRTLASWYISTTMDSTAILPRQKTAWTGHMSVSTFSGLTMSTMKIIVLSYGVEVLFRGASWLVCSRTAMNHA